MIAAELIFSRPLTLIPMVTTPWWVWALVILAMLAVLAVSILIRPGGSEPPPPGQEPVQPQDETQPKEQTIVPPPGAEAVTAPQMAEFDMQNMEVRLPEGDVKVGSRFTETPDPDLTMDEPQMPPGMDNLKAIKGISPGVVAVMNNAGITTYRQLAETSVEDLERILRRAGMFQINPRSWPEQARGLVRE